MLCDAYLSANNFVKFAKPALKGPEVGLIGSGSSAEKVDIFIITPDFS